MNKFQTQCLSFFFLCLPPPPGSLPHCILRRPKLQVTKGDMCKATTKQRHEAIMAEYIYRNRVYMCVYAWPLGVINVWQTYVGARTSPSFLFPPSGYPFLGLNLGTGLEPWTSTYHIDGGSMTGYVASLPSPDLVGKLCIESFHKRLLVSCFLSLP